MAEPERAHRWTGLRQDSGDPFAFGPRVKAMYKSIGIGHESKTIVYSDALTVDKCLAIKKQCDELGFYKGGSSCLWIPDARVYWTSQFLLESELPSRMISAHSQMARKASLSILSSSYRPSTISHASS